MDERVLFVVLDGLGDRPLKELGFKTPLEKARTPNLDAIAAEGITGLMDPISVGVVPGSDTSHLAIFGYEPERYYTGRGPFEVAGVGMELKHGDIAFRVNLATVDEKLIVLDRRAGRIESVEALVKELNGVKVNGVEFLIKAGISYRAGLVMRGKGLSHMVGENDPHRTGEKVLKIRPLDKSRGAKKTALALQKFVELAAKRLKENPVNTTRVREGKLPANYFLVRGAGIHRDIPAFQQKYGLRACCVAGVGLYKGIARLLGMRVLNVKGATGQANTNVKAKFRAAKKALQSNDFVFVHVKAADSFGEDGKWQEKTGFIERIDKAIGEVLDLKNTLMVVTADHSTPCEAKGHSGDPVPIAFKGSGVRVDDVKRFDERSCMKGGLGRIRGLDVMREVMNLLGKAEKYGA